MLYTVLANIEEQNKAMGLCLTIQILKKKNISKSDADITNRDTNIQRQLLFKKALFRYVRDILKRKVIHKQQWHKIRFV